MPVFTPRSTISERVLPPGMTNRDTCPARLHMMTPANTYRTPAGKKRCRACRREAVRKWERNHPRLARAQKTARQRRRRHAGA
jgi:hypothetical protein